jgi:hypothetical protein
MARMRWGWFASAFTACLSGCTGQGQIITSPSAAPQDTSAYATIRAVQVWDSDSHCGDLTAKPCPDPQVQPDQKGVYHLSSWRNGFSGGVMVSNPQARNRFLHVEESYPSIPGWGNLNAGAPEFDTVNVAKSELFFPVIGCWGNGTSPGCSNSIPRENVLQIRVFENLDQHGDVSSALAPPQLVELHYIFDSP